jgi:hypothetical protein
MMELQKHVFILDHGVATNSLAKNRIGLQVFIVYKYHGTFLL